MRCRCYVHTQEIREKEENRRIHKKVSDGFVTRKTPFFFPNKKNPPPSFSSLRIGQDEKENDWRMEGERRRGKLICTPQSPTKKKADIINGCCWSDFLTDSPTPISYFLGRKNLSSLPQWRVLTRWVSFSLFLCCIAAFLSLQSKRLSTTRAEKKST